MEPQARALPASQSDDVFETRVTYPLYNKINDESRDHASFFLRSPVTIFFLFGPFLVAEKCTVWRQMESGHECWPFACVSEDLVLTLGDFLQSRTINLSRKGWCVTGDERVTALVSALSFQWMLQR